MKNTFLEIGDHQSLLERRDVWRRQVSEPVKIYSTGGKASADHAEDSSSEAADEAAAGDVEEQAPPWTAAAAASKPPKLLLLSESIPFQQQKSEKAETDKSQHRAPLERESHKEEREKKDNHNKDGSYINHIKDHDITKKEPPWVDVTTVMMRNLPNKYTQQMLLEELQDAGFRFHADFDFFYLPMDHSNAANLGYCFINFNETSMANAFAAAFQGKKMRRFNSNKTVVVMPASIQGYERNYAYYASTRVAQAEDPQYRPLFLRPPPPGQGIPQVPPVAGKSAAPGKTKGQAKSTANAKGKKGGRESRADGMGPFPGPDLGGYDGGHPGRGGQAAGHASWVTLQPTVPPIGKQTPRATLALAVCWQCGTECSTAHRFCAFCGAFISQGMEAGLMPQLRADAPTFVPGASGGLGGGKGRGNARNQQALLGALNNSIYGAGNTDMVTDELDVMRGRQMLLAALKEMEQREQSGGPSGGPSSLPTSLSNFTGEVYHPDTSTDASQIGVPRSWQSQVRTE